MKTTVEIRIVVVIIGLCAAMAIPAFQKVRLDGIAKRYVSEQRISQEEMNKLMKGVDRLSADLRVQVMLKMKGEVPDASSNYIVTIDGVKYRLVPTK